MYRMTYLPIRESLNLTCRGSKLQCFARINWSSTKERKRWKRPSAHTSKRSSHRQRLNSCSRSYRPPRSREIRTVRKHNGTKTPYSGTVGRTASTLTTFLRIKSHPFLMKTVWPHSRLMFRIDSTRWTIPNCLTSSKSRHTSTNPLRWSLVIDKKTTLESSSSEPTWLLSSCLLSRDKLACSPRKN